MIETLPNEYGDIIISVEEAAGFICLGGPAKSKITVSYIPNNKILELMSFHNWISKEFTEQEKQPLESVVGKIYNELVEVLDTVNLEVIGESPRDLPSVHGPLTVIKGEL